VIADRIRHRTRDVSDADDRVARAMAADADPWPDAVTIRTDTTPESCVDQASRVVRPYATGRPEETV
jgi:predicted kinase